MSAVSNLKKLGFPILVVLALVVFLMKRQQSVSKLENVIEEAESILDAVPRIEEELPIPEGLEEDQSSEYLIGYGDESISQDEDLLKVWEMINAFNTFLKIPGALPTSGNREIVQALSGENPHRIRFIDPASKWINEDGMLMDRYGVPLFFHFEDAQYPGIRSAGPDQKMWTEDDVELDYRLEGS